MSWWTAIEGGCHSATKALTKYHNFLTESGLLPDDLLFENHTFRNLLNLNFPFFRVEWCGVTCVNCSNDRVPPISKDLAREVRSAAAEIKRKWQDFACLNCLRIEKKMNWTCEVCRKNPDPRRI